ncbi:MAG: hypothetical protein CMO34_03970 [Verrucomicrobia bacterium]|nr:hypothetical protein [Verrucomicrobiota bacterium]
MVIAFILDAIMEYGLIFLLIVIVIGLITYAIAFWSMFMEKIRSKYSSENEEIKKKKVKTDNSSQLKQSN